MTSLVSPADVKSLVKTSLPNETIQDVIDRVEAQISDKIGYPQTDTMTTQIQKTMRGQGPSLFVPTEIYAIVSIVEDGDVMAADEYRVWGGGVIERLPMGCNWGDVNTVTYKPADDRLKRKAAIIDLVRLAIERTAMRSESIAGEYSYTAPDNWQAEFRRIMKRLTFQAV